MARPSISTILPPTKKEPFFARTRGSALAAPAPKRAAVAAAMTEGGEEHTRWQSYRAAQKRLVSGEPGDPGLVAEAIYRAATERPGVLRHPVGSDADLVVGAKNGMSFEDFEAAMRQVLDWHE
jgi:hypothetical protein